jgi:hypothetical protein
MFCEVQTCPNEVVLGFTLIMVWSNFYTFLSTGDRFCGARIVVLKRCNTTFVKKDMRERGAGVRGRPGHQLVIQWSTGAPKEIPWAAG